MFALFKAVHVNEFGLAAELRTIAQAKRLALGVERRRIAEWKKWKNEKAMETKTKTTKKTPKRRKIFSFTLYF
jgi:hypothetical protein